MPQIPVGDPYEEDILIPTVPSIGDPPSPYPGTTFIPFQPVKLPVLQPRPVVIGCPGCGINFGENATIGYVCMNVACPMRPQITCAWDGSSSVW